MKDYLKWFCIVLGLSMGDISWAQSAQPSTIVDTFMQDRSQRALAFRLLWKRAHDDVKSLNTLKNPSEQDSLRLKAIAEFQRAIAIMPESPWAATGYINIGDLWMNTTPPKLDDAIQAYSDALAKYPRDDVVKLQALSKLSTTNFEENDLGAAINFCRQINDYRLPPSPDLALFQEFDYVQKANKSFLAALVAKKLGLTEHLGYLDLPSSYMSRGAVHAELITDPRFTLPEAYTSSETIWRQLGAVDLTIIICVSFFVVFMAMCSVLFFVRIRRRTA